MVSHRRLTLHRFTVVIADDHCVWSASGFAAVLLWWA